MSSIILNVNLLNKIQSKFKQPLDDLSLELSYSLNMRESYYIDSHLHYYLTQLKCCNRTESREFGIFKYFFSKGKTFNTDRKYSIKIYKYLSKIQKFDKNYALYACTRLSAELKIIKYLIKEGANPNHFVDLFKCILFYVIKNKNLLIVKHLMKNGGYLWCFKGEILNNDVYKYYLSNIDKYMKSR